MGVKIPAEFEDSTGTIARLTGELELTIPALTGQVLTVDNPATTASFQASGGLRGEREQITGDPVTITDGSSDKLTWDTKDSGTELLDLTDPANPVAVADGIYAVTVEVNAAAITVGGFYTVTLALDTAGDDANVTVSSPPSTAAFGTPIVSVSLTYFIPAGGVLNVTVDSEDGASSVDYNITLASVQAV